MTFNTTQLLGVYPGLMPHSAFLLNLLCASVVTFDTEEIAFDKVSERYKLAPFVSPLVAGRANAAVGSTQRTFKPAYVKPKEAVNPSRVLKRQPGEAIGGQLTTAQRINAIRTAILQDQDHSITYREEWMLAQILRTGKVVVSGENYPAVEVDFGRAAGNTITLAGGTRWSETATRTPNADLETWMGLMDAPCTHIIMGRGAAQYYFGDASTEKLINTLRGSDTKLAMEPAQMFAIFRGRLGNAGPEIWTYTGWYQDEAGTKTTYIADNQVLLVSTAAGGVRMYGAILDANANYAVLSRFPKNWVENDPAVEYLMTQSAPLPVIPLINATVCANVYTL